MIKKLFAYAVASVLLFTGCGGGGTNTIVGQPSTGTGSTAAVASVTVQSSAAQIPADNSAPSTVTALVKDASNNAIQGVSVAFAVSSGSIAVTQATTDANGLATGTVGTGGDTTARTITVTATAGGKSGSTSIAVTANQQTITLTTDTPQVPSDGSKAATITALVRDANNQFLPNVVVSFAATSGGLTVTNAKTDSNGAATATLDSAKDYHNRNIVVTASVGSASATVGVDVVGTKLSISGPDSLVVGSQGTYTVSLLDSGGKGIAAQPIALTSAKGNTLSASSVISDGTGQKTFTVTAVNGGSDTLAATALNLQAQQPVQVSSENFTFTAPVPNSQLNLSTPVPVTIAWLSAGVPQQGKVVNFSSTRGTLSSPTGTTDASGNATVSISSGTSGPALISASSVGVTAQVQATFVATTPSSIDLQASPSTIPTQGKSTLTAVLRDSNNNLVIGKTVNFQLVNDITGGALSVASAVTDGQGTAQTVYTASQTPSGSAGVTISASVAGVAQPATTKLTVGGQTVFLSLGTGNKVNENTAQTQFILPYSVQAVDSAGNAVNGVPITLTVHSVFPGADTPPPSAYSKGYWALGSDNHWHQSTSPNSVVQPLIGCPNEDFNGNGVLDAGEDTSGLGNSNGKLDPGDVAVTDLGTVTTANGGSADFNVIYPEDHAGWVQVTLTATAKVQGTETSTSATFVLPMAAKYVIDGTANPPGAVSPYGTVQNCTSKF